MTRRVGPLALLLCALGEPARGDGAEATDDGPATHFGVRPTSDRPRLTARIVAEGDAESLAEAALELVYHGAPTRLRLGPGLARVRGSVFETRRAVQLVDGDVIVGLGEPRRTFFRFGVHRIEVETLAVTLEGADGARAGRHVCAAAASSDVDAESLRTLRVRDASDTARTLSIGDARGQPLAPLRFGPRPLRPGELPVPARAGDTVALVVEGTTPAITVRLTLDAPACAPRALPLRFVVLDPDARVDAPAPWAIERALDAALDEAATTLSSCGIVPRRTELLVRPPPSPRLATIRTVDRRAGGAGRFVLRVDGQRVECLAGPGDSAADVADRCRRALDDAGVDAHVERLTADVDVADLWLAPPHTFDVPGTAAWLPSGHVVELAAVDATRGPRPFGPGSFGVGTSEERAWLRPQRASSGSALDVAVIPRFTDPTRAGEAFVPSDGGPLAGMVVLGVAALGTGYDTLAHELAHVLLDDPDHAADPDDVMAGVVAGPRPGRLFRRAQCEAMRTRGARFLVPYAD